MDDLREQGRAKRCFHRDSPTRRALRIILAGALLAGTQSVAPAGQESTPDQVTQRPRNPFGDMGDDDPVFAAKRIRALNAERQKNLVSDAGKLLKVATELNTELDSGNSDAFTSEQLRKVAEIEKLARSVKEKMSFAVGGTPTYRESPLPPIP